MVLAWWPAEGGIRHQDLLLSLPEKHMGGLATQKAHLPHRRIRVTEYAASCSLCYRQAVYAHQAPIQHRLGQEATPLVLLRWPLCFTAILCSSLLPQ